MRYWPTTSFKVTVFPVYNLVIYKMCHSDEFVRSNSTERNTVNLQELSEELENVERAHVKFFTVSSYQGIITTANINPSILPWMPLASRETKEEKTLSWKWHMQLVLCPSLLKKLWSLHALEEKWRSYCDHRCMEVDANESIPAWY